MRIVEASASDRTDVLAVERSEFGGDAEAGLALVFVLGHPGYYSRHGFETAGRLGLRAPYPVSPEDAWMVRAISGAAVLDHTQGRIVCAAALGRPDYWRA